MATWSGRIDRLLGWLGLLLVGVLGWAADHARPRPVPAAGRAARHGHAALAAHRR
jgi:hypothetical protein